MDKFIEKYLPIGISFICSLVAYESGYTFCMIPNILNILSSFVSISSIIIGFLATMISVLIVLTDKAVMKRIKTYKAGNMLNSYLFEPIITGFIVSISSTIINLCEKMTGLGARIILSIWVFFVCWFLGTTFRILLVLLSILSEASQENDEGSDGNISRPVIVPKIEDAFKNRNKKQ